MEVSDKYRDTKEFYQKRGLSGRVGFGQRPAVIVIDFVKGFTDPRSPLAGNLQREMEETVRILREARKVGAPIFYTTVAYQPDLSDAGVWKKKVPSAKWLVQGSEWVELDPILERQPEEPVITKKYASAFFGTDLISRLVSRRVDTLIVTGCTTSGCVRATVMDAVNYGLHAIVPAEAVGDRAELPHEANLFDIDAKYGDVVTVDDVITYLSGLPQQYP